MYVLYVCCVCRGLVGILSTLTSARHRRLSSLSPNNSCSSDSHLVMVPSACFQAANVSSWRVAFSSGPCSVHSYHSFLALSVTLWSLRARFTMSWRLESTTEIIVTAYGKWATTGRIRIRRIVVLKSMESIVLREWQDEACRLQV